MSLRSLLPFIAGVTFAVALPVFGQAYQSHFPDISSSAYFSNAVTQLADWGVIQGYENGNFGPNDSVTRAQVAVMFSRYDQSVVQPLRDQLTAIDAKLGITPSACSNGHETGDSYPSVDGCNTCSCTISGEVCTLRACSVSSSSKKSASSSSSRSSVAPVCGNGICEQGEASYCPSQNCQPGEVCPMYCLAGSCLRDCTTSSSASSTFNQCAPYICNDGTSIPSCSSDGHTINYFAAPCLSHGGEAGQ
jgi:hypothetical protein